MNIFHKVTLESLKKNRTRTIVTIIGIMLSTALICAVTTSFSSVVEFGRRYFAYETGTWHGMGHGLTYETYEEIVSSDKVDKAVYGKYEGYSCIGSKNYYKEYLYLMGASEGFEEIMPVHITEGHYPQNDSEILIPQHYYESGDVVCKTGDKITLEVGDRKKYGMVLTQNTPIYDKASGYMINETEEEFVPRFTKEYTVCGIYERPYFEKYDSAGYTAIVKATDSEITPNQYDVYFSMKDPDDVYPFMKDHGMNEDTNYELLMFYGSTGMNTFKSMFMWLAVIVIGLIVFGSIMLIYNAFSISVSERTKQFGLLSSIGATKKQIRKMVKYESFVVSVIGIPLGILLGIAGMWVTFSCIGGTFTNLLGSNIPENIKMKLSVSTVSVIAAVIIALVTIRVSAWIPSRRATKISAVDAIRQSADIKAKKKKLRTPKIVYKLFGLSGMLGHKYFKRSRKRYRSTIISLFMSIVLFISASAFNDYLVRSFEFTSDASGFDIVYYWEPREGQGTEDESAVLGKISSADHVSSVALIEENSVNCSISKEYFNKEILSYYELGTAMNPDPDSVRDSSKIDYFIVSFFIDETAFQRVLDEYDISREELMSDGNIKGITFDGGAYYDPRTERYVKDSIFSADDCRFECTSYKTFDDSWFECENEDFTATYRYPNGECVDIPLDECKKEFVLESGRTIHDRPFFNNSFGVISVVYPISERDRVWESQELTGSIMYAVNSDNPDLSYDCIREMLVNEGYNSGNLINVAESERANRNLLVIVNVFAYGFIILISLIAAANVFNTISTNIALRRREFAMLRSIGMTSKGIRRILNYECILYGVKSLAAGLPVSVLVTYFIYKAIMISMDIGFVLPWKAIIIASLSVFAVVFTTMLYSMNKLKKDNPIDALKNENL